MRKRLRNKWRLKMKAIKRESYGKKELERLKKVIEGSKKEGTKEIDMTDLQTLVNGNLFYTICVYIFFRLMLKIGMQKMHTVFQCF
ncbi:hypothetical protein O3M35_001791 [Rhynocoris fuscipes]|uniref:Uncharacterized protein n=1 Tax=Rhynocoris fuscipes TaxID=488301 RepID=A0AAW1CVD4_9HEMI